MGRTPDAVAFKELFNIFRRHVWLIVAVNAFTIGVAAYLAFSDPRVYRAAAVVRLSQGPQALTADIQDATPQPQRTVDPVLSLTQRLRSRQVIARVVDSLGLRLNSLTSDFPRSRLRQIRVDPSAPVDSIALHLTAHEAVAHLGTRELRAPYGEVMKFDGVEFAVTALVPPDEGPEDVLLAVAAREAEIDQVLTGIEVIERQGTDVIDVAYSATDPETAQNVVNAVVRTFQAVNVRSAQEQSRLRETFLSEQLRQTDSAFAQAQATLAIFRSRQQLASSADKLAAAQTALLALDAQKEQLLADRQTYGTLPDLLRSPDDSVREEALRDLAYSPEMASNPAVAKLSQQQIEYQRRLDSLTTGPSRSAETNPDVAQLRGLVGTTQQQLLDAVQTQVRSLDSRISALTGLRQRSGVSIQALPALAAEEVRLEARVDALRTIGDHLRQESLRAGLSEAAEVGDMQIMDLASLPYLSTWPAGLLKLALGVFAGVLFGGGAAYLLETTNTSIRRPEDLEDALHIGGLAVIPRVPGAGKTWTRQRPRLARGNGKHPDTTVKPLGQGLVTLSQPRSIGTEAFRMLRTSIILSDWGKQLKTIVVTSVAPGEGKTLTAANLAVVFAREGRRVLLIDGDPRRARLHKLFLTQRGPGFGDLIQSDGKERYAGGHTARPIMSAIEPDGPIRRTAVDDLYLLPAGKPSGPAEAFREDCIRQLLSEVSSAFDLVIIDAPPVLATADATILASVADGVLFVVRAGRTNRRAIQHAHQHLVQVGARIVGTVLNDPQGELRRDEEYYYPYEYPEVKE